jgi:hypothetical protein
MGNNLEGFIARYNEASIEEIYPKLEWHIFLGSIVLFLVLLLSWGAFLYSLSVPSTNDVAIQHNILTREETIEKYGLQDYVKNRMIEFDMQKINKINVITPYVKRFK